MEEALGSVTLGPADAAAVSLARRYAGQIDADSTSLTEMGPKFLAVLAALRLTPAARTKVASAGGAQEDSDVGGPARVTVLRGRARARLDRG